VLIAWRCLPGVNSTNADGFQLSDASSKFVCSESPITSCQGLSYSRKRFRVDTWGFSNAAALSSYLVASLDPQFVPSLRVLPPLDVGARLFALHISPISPFDEWLLYKRILKVRDLSFWNSPSKIFAMSNPPPAFKGDLTWDTATVVSFWLVGPLYGMS
jgi:hypothetical protein